MKHRRGLPLFLLAAAFVPCLLWATSGSFRGTIIEAPEGESKDQVLFIKGRNGLVRKVDITGASVVYEASVPESQRKKTPASALKSGTEVRITAEQGASGEWKATQVEIVGPDEQRPVERERPAVIDEHTSVT